jgi:hypothetical protein
MGRRALAPPKLPEEVKAELTRGYRSYNPVVLRIEVRAAIEALAGIHAAAGTVSPIPAVQGIAGLEFYSEATGRHG